MRISRPVASRLSLALVIAGSTLAITCASRVGIQNEPVQLASIRKVEASFDRILDVGIRNGLLGGRTGIGMDTDEMGGPLNEDPNSGVRIFNKRLRFYVAQVIGRELTVAQLQRLRTALHLRVDEAYASRGDLTNFADLKSLNISGNAISGSLNQPAAIGR